MQFTTDAVRISGGAKNKKDALAQVAKALQEQGLVQGDYTDALLLREDQASTYLGAGIAIPHGALSHKDRVQKTGVAVVHFADGVDWGDGQTAYVAVGIAAKGDEHLQILRLLAQKLDDADLANKLRDAQNASEIVAALQGDQSDKAAAPSQKDDPPFVAVEQGGDFSCPQEALLALACALKPIAKGDASLFAHVFDAKLWHLKDDLWCLHAPSSKAAFALVGTSSPFAHQGFAFGRLAAFLGMDDRALGRAVAQLLLLPKDATAADYRALFDEAGDFCSGQVRLVNRHGLHARPATALAKLAASYPNEILVAADGGKFVSAKSLVRLLGLGATYGQRLTFRVKASAAASAAEVLQTLIAHVQAGLGEEVESAPTDAHKGDDDAAQGDDDLDDDVLDDNPPLPRGEPLYGICASEGVACAPAWAQQALDFTAEKDAPLGKDEEKRRLNQAIEATRQDIKAQILQAKNDEIADIFAAHAQLLDDDELRLAAYAGIEKGQSAFAAFKSAIDELVALQAKVDNPLLAERAADLADVGQQVLRSLRGEKIHAPDGDYALIKEELLPSDVARLDGNVVALLTATGGASSHSAIIARSLGIPAIVGAGSRVLQIQTGETVLIDAHTGQFVVDPSADQKQKAQEKQNALKQERARAAENARLPATTQDGARIHVFANIGELGDADNAIAQGAEGVGLLRTEFVFMRHNAMPDVAAQIADYRPIFEAVAPYPVVARTLDVGGDKPLPYLRMKDEENPFLGVRGIRLSLNRPKLLKDQIDALLAASDNSPLRIMFPMIGQIREWQAAKAILDAALKERPHPDAQVGMMIEVPSAAILADKFAEHVDFFSVGTNDLTQYALAIDRGHPMLSAMADGLHPSVLRLIDTTVKAARAHGKWVGVCGELASDPEGVPILLGLGVDELSVSPSKIALVKEHIRRLKYSDCQRLAAQALECKDAAEARSLVQDFAASNAPTP